MYIPTDVCEILGVSKRSLQRWTHNQLEHGSVLPPPNPTRGRPRILNVDATYDIMSLLDETPEMFLDEIQDWLTIAHDVKISRTALFENIRDSGVTYKMLRKAAAERDEEARALWKAEMQENYVASQVIVVDESSKDDRTLFRPYGRAPSGHRATIPANFVRGQCYSLVAAMGVNGYVGTRVVEGSVDGEEFLNFIVDIVRFCPFSTHPSSRKPPPQDVFLSFSHPTHPTSIRSRRVSVVVSLSSFPRPSSQI